jgi:hypothetical protein
MPFAGSRRHHEGMSEDDYSRWAEDADVLARIGQHLFGQPTRVIVRLPRDLADEARARWQRDGDQRPLPPETPEEWAARNRAATLGLIGLSIERESMTDNGDVIVALDAWHIGDAFNAADEAGLIANEMPRRR